jgi:serine/threonine protein kinase
MRVGMNTRLVQHAEPIPGYRLVDRLGRGGFGEVWKVVAPGGVFKAIKFVNGDMEDARGDNRAAEQELKALDRVKTIRHPYILSIDRFDIIGGQLMIVMEMADRSLWERFEQCRSQGHPGLPRDELLRYMDEASEALDLMNFQYQIQHLDIKPQNLLLIHNHIKVADFGLAKDFEGMRGVVTGGITPVYAAPETSEGWISRFCDQYSLAIVYQELLTGKRPFAGTNAAQLLIQHLTAAPDVSHLPTAEREIVARALSKKPDERFASCAEFVQALRRADSALVDSARPPTIAAATNHASSHSRHSESDEVATKPAAPTPEKRAPAMPSSVPKSATAPGVLEIQTRVSDPASTSETLPTHAGPKNRPFRNRAHDKASGPGVIFPTYLVAAGKLGACVLQCLRSRLFKHFDEGTFPHWRWLFIDTDEATIAASTSGSTRQSLTENEVYHARMERPLQYMKREGLPPPRSWMGNDMLYRIPRQPATAGIRCLGRLALLDHTQALAQRIKQDLGAILNDAALDDAAQKTRLAIRSRNPRVYVAASLTGGTGSGMLIDLAYLIRDELHQAGFVDPQLTGLLLAPAVDNRSSSPLAIANSFATLAELHHWSLSANAFEARFDSRRPSRTDPDRPFDRCVLLSLPKESSVDVPPAAGHAADLILQEALTPVGRSADEARDDFRAGFSNDGLSLQSCGSYRIVWPRRRLLDTISYRYPAKTIKDWMSSESSPSREELVEWFDTKWREHHLDPAALRTRLHEAAAATLGASPESSIEAVLKSLPQPGNSPDPFPFATIIDRITAQIGKAGTDEETAPGKIAGIFKAAMEPLSKEADEVIARLAAFFVNEPNCRIAAAEGVIRLCAERAQSQIDEYDGQADRVRTELEEGYKKIVAALGALAQVVPKRAAQAMVELHALLRDWSRKRLNYLTSRCVVAIYRQILSNAPECLRATGYCRQQLLDWATRLDNEAASIADPSIGNDQLILPPGCKTLLEAADLFIEQMAGDHPLDFKIALLQLVGEEHPTLATIGRAIKESGLRLVKEFAAQAASIAEPRLGMNATAAALLREYSDSEQLRHDLLHAFEKSKPDDFGPPPAADAQSFLLGITSDEPGRELKALTKILIPDRPVIEADSTDEIVFYREYHALSLSDLPQMGPAAMQAVREVKAKQRINPFSRIDVNWTTCGRD